MINTSGEIIIQSFQNCQKANVNINMDHNDHKINLEEVGPT